MSQLLNHTIKNKYKVVSLIGKGNFSEVLQCINLNTNSVIAIKIEQSDTVYKTITNEAKIMNYLQNNKCKYIPTVYWYGKYLNYNCLAISFYDCSLATYIQNNRLTLKEINEYMVQLLSIINEIHNNFVIHRDIKPDNFMFKNNKLYIIDFGLSTYYINEHEEHIPNNTHTNILGSPNYISYNIHNGNTYSRRDDLISIMYLYIELIYQKLPWSDVIRQHHDEYNDIHILNPANMERQQYKSLEYIKNFVKNNEILCDIFNYLYDIPFSNKPLYEYVANKVHVIN
jgi:serine/threonine protein kinase